MRWKRALQFAAAGLVFATLASCGASTGGSAATSSVAAEQAKPTEQSPATVKLVASEADGLGTIVTDREGFSLYRFDNDTGKPSKSNCDGDCAAAWPPVIAGEDNVEVEGVDASIVGTVERTDGTRQVTIAGWPVYHYSKDKAPGEVNGQGAGNRWFAVTPQGKKAQSASAEPGGEPVALVVMKVGTLGEIVTDREGMTLYRFDKDTASPSKSNCDGECAQKWPPVIATSDNFELQGLDRALVGTVERSDGSRQVTIAGWPVYHFSGDKVPCDTNGQGVGGVWFALTAQGKKAT